MGLDEVKTKNPIRFSADRVFETGSFGEPTFKEEVSNSASPPLVPRLPRNLAGLLYLQNHCQRALRPLIIRS